MKFFHQHRFAECYGGLYADEHGGPRTVHEIWWECQCGAVRDPEAKARAQWADRMDVVAIVPRRVIYAKDMVEDQEIRSLPKCALDGIKDRAQRDAKLMDLDTRIPGEVFQMTVLFEQARLDRERLLRHIAATESIAGDNRA